MRIPTLGALTLAAAATVVALPTAANAAPPTTVSDSAQVLFQSFAKIDVLTNDKNNAANSGKNLTVTSTTIDTPKGAVSCTSAGVCTYSPDDGWVGTETFNYTVSDGTETGEGTVIVRTINVGQIGSGLSTQALKWGNALTLTTFVKDPSGALVNNVDMKLMARVTGGVYEQVGGIRNTGPTGQLSTSLTPTQTTTYKWMVENRSSISKQVTVTPKLTTVWGDKTMAVGETTGVTVTTAPVTEGGKAVLERRLGDGSWEPVAGAEHVFTSTSTADQTFTLDIPVANGSRTYRVNVPENGGREATASKPAAVKGYQVDVVDFDPANTDEWVKLANTGKVSVNLEGWELSDGTSVTLPQRSLPAGETLKIHSGSGTNKLRNLYLKKTARFWEANSVITLSDDNAKALSVFPAP